MKGCDTTQPTRRCAVSIGACFVFELFLVATVAQADPHAAFGGLLNSVNSARSGAPLDEGLTMAQGFYVSDVEPVVQQSCVVCHGTGLTADQQGARLLFGNDPNANHRAIEAFVTTPGVGADWLLGKIVGDLGHGGGPVIAPGGADYLVFADYLTLLVGANTGDGSADASALWEGTTLESRETTLRRAAVLLAGRVPSQAMINRGTASEGALKVELKGLMEGEGFHDFLITGANDRLLTDGLNAGIDFQFDFWGRFPAFVEFANQFPDERPEEFRDYHDKPFLTRDGAQEEFRNAVVREPLELIADVVMTNQSYKNILTASYTMVNPISALAYRSDAEFDIELTDAQGFYDRSQFYAFKRGKNQGHIPYDEDTYHADDGTVSSFSGYHEWPHAGVLTTPAFLSRYPSTDTNRNRARARWTYFHFLGVDIEKSAPRTTDPVALADTNNPTLYNPACTVCHERLDPAAGAFQRFGDRGHYLDQWGGMDSLPDTYKHPQKPSGDVNELQRDPALEQEAIQLYQRQVTLTTRGAGGNFLVNDVSPRGCVEDETNSIEGDWRGWCSHVGVKEVVIKQGSRTVRTLPAEDFQDDPSFSPSVWTDPETGEEHANGWFHWDGQQTVYFSHTNNWVSFDFDLPDGDYTIEVTLASTMTNGHPEMSVLAGLSWNEGHSRTAGYQYGDTWYRDMRRPGFEGQAAPGDKDSLQWLALEIVNDPRFGEATVKFWWASVFGADPMAAPADPGLPDYEAHLLAFNAQEALVKELAAGFAASGFKLKDLLADMVMSRWYRTGSISTGLDPVHEVALANVGRGRLLTPEELDRKNRAVLGRTWGEYHGGNAHSYEPESNFNRGWGGYATFYGGIDGATVTRRNRNLTSLMSNVTEKMAVDLACQVVLDDFRKPRSERSIFTEVEKTTDPLRLDGAEYQLDRDSFLPQDTVQFYERSVDFTTGGDGVTLTFRDVSPSGCVRDDANSTDERWEGWCSHMGVESLELRRFGRRVLFMTADEFETSDRFRPQTWTDQETGETHIQGWWHFEQDYAVFFANTNGSFALAFDLAPGDYTLTVNLASVMQIGHPEDAIVVDVGARAHQYDPTGKGAVAFEQQLDQLYLRATATALTDHTRTAYTEAFLAYADDSAAQTDWFDGHCDTWSLEGFRGELTHDAWWALQGDPSGGLRAWTLLLHGLMTSYPYLHD